MARLNADAVAWREVEGEVVALDVVGNRYIGINPSGAVLWPLLVDGAEEPDLTAALVDRFGIEPTAAAQDVRSFLEALTARGLLL